MYVKYIDMYLYYIYQYPYYTYTCVMTEETLQISPSPLS